jgi:transposase
MVLHRNAKLGLAGRYALVRAVEDGLSLRAAAVAFGVSPGTACRWSRRWREAGEEERRALGCLHDRSSRPRRMPRLLALAEQRRICAARRRTGWGPRLLTVRVGHPPSTISKVLRRHALSRPAKPPREPARRYEWPCPGDLLHMDVAHYARFNRPGHAVTGDRTSTAAEKRARVGYDYAHAIVDDHSRLGYAELLADERGADRHRLRRSRARFLRRARNRAETVDDRQRLELHAQQLAPAAARPARDPPPTHAKAPPAAKRESRALPPDDGPRVGIRPPLPHTSTPPRRPATLAALLQRAQTPQLTRRPTPDQPRSQRL